MTKTISLPEALTELLILQRKYKSLGKAPLNEKDKMTAIALSIGGFEALADSQFGYLDYLEELSQRRNELYLAGNEEEIKEVEQKLGHFASMLHSNYSESFSKLKRTQQRYATVYVEVEKYRSKFPNAKILHATNVVAEKLDEDPKFVHTRYYQFRKESRNMPIDEVIKQFQLPITS